MSSKLSRLAASIVMSSNEAFVTRNFSPRVYGGEPSNIARIFSELEVDELIIVNTDSEPSASYEETLRRISRQTFIPITFAGGISSVEQAEAVSRIGFEKVLVEKHAIDRPGLVSEIASSLGSSSVVSGFSFVGQQWVDWRTRKPHGNKHLEKAIREAQQLGAGEIKISSISRDGTREGPDLDLVALVSSWIGIPFTYQGGVTSVEQAQQVWDLGADCVAASSWFLVKPPHNAILASYPKRENR